ncbi:hypothetical protein T484DRAFT_1744960 [Baffinella frigidus]|nr:hypothetical protein T484DRAFT_1744960 [Cryptophyta sp. CCMP2293]
MPENKNLTWEADEVRSGGRKIPGFAGHVSGLNQTMGVTYGASSALVLNPETGPAMKRAHTCALFGHRVNGYTTPGDVLSPYKLSIYRTAPINDYTRSHIIPHYAGHQPGWCHAHGQTTGKYVTDALAAFNSTNRSRKFAKSSRLVTAPADIMAGYTP